MTLSPAVRQRRRRGDAALPRRRWTDRLALGGTLLALAVVVIVNWVIVGRTERLRTSILEQSEAVRAVSDSVAFTVARQAINLQAFLLTDDSTHLGDYRAARAEGNTRMRRLESTSRDFGTITARNFGTVALLRAEWQDRHDEILSAPQPREAALAQVDEERVRVLDLLAVISDLAGVAQLRGAERRAAIVRMYRFGAVVTALMALLALLSVASAYRYRRRLYARSDEARSRAGQLERALRDRQEILAIVSHDLRNSLNVVVAALGLARETRFSEDEKAKQLRVAYRTSTGMSRLISDLLDVSTLESGELRVDRRPCDPSRILADALEAWGPEAATRGVALEGRGEEPLADIHADPGRILQVLGNLLANAIKFTPESGTVSVTVSPVDGGVRFQVEDTGPGIPAEHLPRIFDRFYQVRSSGRAGAGLGLAIARGIVEAHDSTLEVETWPGSGTRFWFDLPAASGGRNPADAQSNWVTKSANQARKDPTATAG